MEIKTILKNKNVKITAMIILIIAVTAIVTFWFTIHNLEINTDGNGDSAFVEILGQKIMYGINGYSL